MSIQQFPLPSSTGLTYNAGATSARPSSPAIGENYYNTTNNNLEIWDGTNWTTFIVPASFPVWNAPTEGTAIITTTDGTSTSYSGFSVTDPQGDTLTWAASSLPTGLSISSTSGVVSGTASVGITSTTTYAITVSASDGTNISRREFNIVVNPSVPTDFLVIAGGGGGGPGGTYNGGGGSGGGGGGGAGGYRTSAGTSGANTAAAAQLSLSLDTAYTVTVGAGGAAGKNNGSNSVFSTITSTGGGGGGPISSAAGSTVSNGNSGGSGGGGGGSRYSPFPQTSGTGTASQGTAGGTGITTTLSAGGGGAGFVPSTTSDGGNGLDSSITGSSVTRAGGGGGGAGSSFGTSGTGGTGGGGNASATGSATGGTSGTVNTGSGGGGGGGAGGSGIVVISIPSAFVASFTGGVTQASTTTGGKNVYIVTAAGTSDTVTFTAA